VSTVTALQRQHTQQWRQLVVDKQRIAAADTLTAAAAAAAGATVAIAAADAAVGTVIATTGHCQVQVQQHSSVLRRR
jgi:3-oxoacyl-ACP reductase-like protein